MCGIFGYIGTKDNASNLILEGLKTLDYRGYDSWGIAIKTESNDITIEKSTGKIGNVTLSPEFAKHKTHIGIGHTRWATHGGVTLENAHPHYDCTKQLAVLHNGIIENFQELKTELIKKGHTFTSETDTEVIAHLLEDATKTTPFVDAIQEVFGQLKGMNAVLAINTKTSEIVAAKNGSPLIVGVSDDGYYLSSDPAAILPHTKQVIFVKDNELVHLTNKLEMKSLPDGKTIEPTIETLNWSAEQATKGDFDHFMMKEIHEQPTMIQTIANTYTEDIAKLAEVVKQAKGTFFIGSGTAFNACLAGTYLFSKVAKMHVNTAPASEFNYLEDFLNDKSLIIPLSQSGETIDVIEPLNRAKKKGSKIMALVNVLGSTIYRMGDYKLVLGAGPEKAVASTKAYVAKIVVLTMLVYTIAGKVKEGQRLLLNAAKEIQRLLLPENLTKMQNIARLLAPKKNIFIIGRGVSYATALEGALKIKEVSYIPTEGLAGGELKHGTIALIEKGTPCIVLAPDDETHDAILSNAMEIKSRGGFMIGVSTKNSPIFDEWIEVRNDSESLVTQIVPFQLLAYYLAIEKNLDPDKPRNLAKSVTVK